jgi:folate-binding protein YgfZ
MGANHNQAMSTHDHPLAQASTPAAQPSEPQAQATAQPDFSAAHTIALPHLSVVEVQGPDAGSFLQGQLTQDALSMQPSQARAGGYCSAKGRLLANFVMLHPDEGRWFLLTHADLQEALVKRLKMFVLRAQCSVQVRQDLEVFGEHSTGAGLWSVRSLVPSGADAGEQLNPAWALGWWGGRTLWIASKASSPQADGDPRAASAQEAWRHADVMAAWPWIEAATVDQFVPQMINFELLGGVNFRKGCYPGQEVVARSQYRGTLKRRMALFVLPAHTTPLAAAGLELFHSEDPGQPAGMVVNAARDAKAEAQHCLLAEVKLSALTGGTLHLGAPQGPQLQPLALPYSIPSETGA